MRSVIAVIYVFILSFVWGQKTTTIYCFPGQGSDYRIFDSLAIDSSFAMRVIEYGTPQKNQTMEEFVLQFVNQIDTTQDFILCGVSLGGMLCVELAEILNPQKTILISSAKNRNELPGRYSFQKKFPLYKIFPGIVMRGGAKFLQPIVEPDRNKNKSTFKKMLSAKSPKYMKRTVGLIVRWDRETNSKPIYHIHGSNDHTLPIKHIQNPNYIVAEGSHMITLTRAKEISLLLNAILLQ